MTKSELNARLPVPLSKSALKKISLANLQARVDALRSESNHFGIDPDKEQVLDDSEQLTPTKQKKPRVVEDGVLFPALAERKEPRAGTKRALIIDMLRDGTTVDEIAEATGWSRDVASSAIWGDVKGTGHGVERIDGQLFLLPRGK